MTPVVLMQRCVSWQSSDIFCGVLELDDNDFNRDDLMSVRSDVVRKTGCLDLRPVVLGMLILVLGLTLRIVPATAGEMKKFTLVAVEIDKTKFWLPSSITVYEGDDVELTLNNKLTAPHGFKLAAYDIEVEVPSLQKRTVHFTANKAGAYPFICQLHAPHVGGQVVVLSK